MVVLSLAAMRERDLFGSFEPQHLTGCIYIAMWGISQVDVTYPPHGMHLYFFVKCVFSSLKLYLRGFALYDKYSALQQCKKPSYETNHASIHLSITCEWNAISYA